MKTPATHCPSGTLDSFLFFCFLGMYFPNRKGSRSSSLERTTWFPEWLRLASYDHSLSIARSEDKDRFGEEDFVLPSISFPHNVLAPLRLYVEAFHYSSRTKAFW